MSGIPFAPALQRGGSSDLDALWDELAHWPGYYVTSIVPSGSYGTFDHEGDRPADPPGSFRAFDPSSWCVEVEPEGWGEHRGGFLDWGATIALAAEGVAEEMRHRREDPHYAHIEDKLLLAECQACVDDCGRLDIDRAELERDREIVLG